MSKAGTLFGALAIVFTLGVAQAAVITNADLVGGTPTLTLPANYTIDTAISSSQTIDGVYDGEAGNPGNGRVVFRQNSGADLSTTNFISIVADLNQIWEINSLQIAHDWGGASTQEVIDVEVLLNNSGGTVATFSATMLNDGNINDIDDVFTGESVSPVTQIEFRITDAEGNPHVIELREIIINGQVIPEPSTYLVFTGLALCFGLAGWWRKRRQVAA